MVVRRIYRLAGNRIHPPFCKAAVLDNILLRKLRRIYRVIVQDENTQSEKGFSLSPRMRTR
jgi:hypothetical protein